MSYQEREISRGVLEKYLRVLDSDEGIRMETGHEIVFVNRTSKRYCVEVVNDGKDEFLYMNELGELLNFLSSKTGPASRIFLY